MLFFIIFREIHNLSNMCLKFSVSPGRFIGSTCYLFVFICSFVVNIIWVDGIWINGRYYCQYIFVLYYMYDVGAFAKK